MDAERRRALEAVLMVTTEPVPPQLLAQLLEISVTGVEAALADLAEECAGRGFVLEQVAGGYRFASHPDCAPYVERFVLAREPTRLSGAALETLGIIAYKQPVSRAQIAVIRGVNVDGVVRTLQRRGLVAEVARDPGPGNAVLFGTTGLFLESLGLDSLGDLPPLGDFVPDAEVTEALDATLRSGERPRHARSPEEAAEQPGPEPREEHPAPDRPT
ncbi:MAG: SMC-Scp complex subunit ScpB [Acidimicrobiia bacterium]|nr:SMC-Scp complex subunit ScpB [Acidimicrobiia bacterium]